MIKRSCVICGKEFECYPSDKKHTCSNECSAKYRSQQHMGVSNNWSDDAKKSLKQNDQRRAVMHKLQPIGVAAALMDPQNQRGPQNRNSHIWLLVSPEGNEIEVVNLLDWVRNNYRLFEPDAIDPEKSITRIRTGFSAIASSINGTRKGRPSMSYKGWTLKYAAKKSGTPE